MAKDNGYDELLSMFDDEASKKVDQASSNTKKADEQKEKAVPKKPAPPPVQQPKSSMAQRFNKEYEDIASDSSRDNNGKNSGVYFANPPRDISKRAAKEQGVLINSETKRRVNKRSQALKENAEKKTKSKNEKLKNAGIMIAIIAVVSLVLCVYGIGCINDVLSLNVGEEAKEVRVEKGMTDSDVVNILHDADLINNKLFCKFFLKVMEITDNDRAEKDYITGIYTLTPDMGVEKMLDTMKTDFTSAETITLTFPEGWTIDQIAEKLDTNKVCTASSFISTLQTVDFSEEYDFIKKISDKNKRFRVLEGYIYPDTYEFYVGENASSVVRRFLDNFKNKWSEEYQAQADKLGLSVDEVVIMASILQEEAATAEQMPKIASVLYNRLDKPNAFPLLQCDSTEDYLLKTIKPGLTSSVEDQQKYLQYRDTYDTYSEACKGLPVGAIANPGNDAINAALNPADTSYLYFRHDAKGGVYYANTFAEHEENGRIAAKVKE